MLKVHIHNILHSECDGTFTAFTKNDDHRGTKDRTTINKRIRIVALFLWSERAKQLTDTGISKAQFEMHTCNQGAMHGTFSSDYWPVKHKKTIFNL